jgi:hypothetical protein
MNKLDADGRKFQERKGVAVVNTPTITSIGLALRSWLAVERSERGSGVARRFIKRWLEVSASARGSSRPAGPRSICHLLLSLALWCRLDDATFAFDCRKRTAVEIVKITSNLQFAGVVDKSRLIGEVNPDLRRPQLNVLLDGAEHVLDPLRRPALMWPRDVEENLGVFGWILYAHAAMAIGAELLPKQMLVRRVVLID